MQTLCNDSYRESLPSSNYTDRLLILRLMPRDFKVTGLIVFIYLSRLFRLKFQTESFVYLKLSFSLVEFR